MEFIELFKDLPNGFHKVTEEDKPLVALTFAQSFADYPYPIPTTKPTTYSTYLRFFYDTFVDQVDNAMERGVALSNEDYSAVMLVTPVDKACNLDLEKYADNMRHYADDEHAKNMLNIMKRIDRKKSLLNLKKDTVYIEGLAVQTKRQGQKLGSSLLRMLFNQCKKDNRDIFLFTNTQRNADIYQHLGFETILFDHCEELNSDTWFMLHKS